ncbi:MAG: hypothetical protein ACREMY_23060, partial [bacterium]
MKFTHSVGTIALVGAMVISLGGCGASTGASQQPASAAASQAPAGSSQAPAADVNMFGGPIYSGDPDLAATAALIDAGGGAESFSFQTALVSMLGQDTVNGEVAKLTTQYGATDVKGFIDGMDFAVKDAIKLVTAASITLPAAPADLHGVDLAKALVKAGTAPDGTFWAGYLFDQALSHKIHNQVMADIDQSVGAPADLLTHRILNQAMFDVAQALGLS